MRSKVKVEAVDSVLVNCFVFESIPTIPEKLWYFYLLHGVRPNNQSWMPIYHNDMIAQICGIDGKDSRERSDKITKARAALCVVTKGMSQPRLIKYTNEAGYHSWGVPMDKNAARSCEVLNKAYEHNRGNKHFTAEFGAQFSPEMPAVWNEWLGECILDLPGFEALEGDAMIPEWSKLFAGLNNTNKTLDDLKVPRDLRLNALLEVAGAEAQRHPNAVRKPVNYLWNTAQRLNGHATDEDRKIVEATVRVLSRQNLGSVDGKQYREGTSKVSTKVVKEPKEPKVVPINRGYAV